MSKKKKAKREQFRTQVFLRDGYRCKVCGKAGRDSQGGDLHEVYHSSENLCLLDAHHITPRAEMSHGGYVVENGISLCEECHPRAEEWLKPYSLIIWKDYSPDNLYKLIDSSEEMARRKDIVAGIEQKFKWHWCGLCKHQAITCPYCKNISCSGGGCDLCIEEFTEANRMINEGTAPLKETIEIRDERQEPNFKDIQEK